MYLARGFFVKVPFTNYVDKTRGVGSQKCWLFVNFHKLENVNGGGHMVKKSRTLVNVVCKWPLLLLQVFHFYEIFFWYSRSIICNEIYLTLQLVRKNVVPNENKRICMYLYNSEKRTCSNCTVKFVTPIISDII